MCKVMEDMRNESLREGMERGLKEGMERGLKEGVERGLKEGVKEGVKTAALRMLSSGKYALEEIAEISGLSLDEVKSLQSGQGA